MPRIAPFRSYYFNAKDKEDLESLVSPPHDVISDAERSEFLKKNPHNIVQIILPESYPKAAQILDYLIMKKHLVQSKSPALYVYGMKFMFNGQQKMRYGLVSLVELTDFSERQIIPHEKTFKRVTEGRFNLFKKTKANFNPIFFIFNGDDVYSEIIQKTITKPVFLKAQDRDGVIHSVWVIDDPKDITVLQDYFTTVPLTIADGHHRYTSALALKQEGRCKYILGLLVSMNDPGLLVLPTHRLIRYVQGLTTQEILDTLSKYFVLESFDYNPFNLQTQLGLMLKGLELKTTNAFGMVLYNVPKLFIISLKPEYTPESLIDDEISDEWKRLDVSLLRKFVFKKLLKIPQFINDSENVEYIKTVEDAILSIRRGLHQLLFILNPTKVEQILKITQLNETMPHKSTYFYPKPLSGLLIYKWE